MRFVVPGESVGGTRGGVDFSMKYEHVELPQTLEPDAKIEVAGLLDLVDDSLEHLGAWDPTGRKWLIGRAQLKALKKQAQKIQQQ